MIIYEKVINAGTEEEETVECSEEEATQLHYHYEDKPCHIVKK
jgi:hypothetical protein